MTEVKYLIIGGGLAGATLGYYLLRNNVTDVCIIEKDKLPKDKLCAGIVSEKSQLELKKIFTNSELEKLYINCYNNVDIHADKNLVIENCKVNIVKRFDLDNSIINKYIDLNGKYVNDELIKIDIEKNIAFLKSGEKIKYEYLISAEGVNSKIRKILDNDYSLNSKLFSYETTTPIDNIKEEYKNKLIISFKGFKKGYGWTITRGNDIVIGMGDISRKY